MFQGLEVENRHDYHHRRVLVMDPDSTLAQALAVALRGTAQVEWVVSGMAGLMLAANQEVDVVIANASLPHVSSAHLPGILRALRPGLPIAIMGAGSHGLASENDRMDLRLPKPLDLKAILAWIGAQFTESAHLWADPLLPPVSAEVPLRHVEIVRCVLKFIERNAHGRIPLPMIAQRAGVSRSHLSRVFKRVTGLSLKRYLTRRRLQAARGLLRNTGAAIHQVASRVGFKDTSHFDRVFRCWEGQTPSRYRRQAILRAKRSGLTLEPISAF